ncbi:MAG: hypothetical protein ABSA41_01750 [Terriglobia bacterium]
MKQRNTYANLRAPEKVVWRHLRVNLRGPFEDPMLRMALGHLCWFLVQGQRRGHFPRSTYRMLRSFCYSKREALSILEGLASPAR